MISFTRVEKLSPTKKKTKSKLTPDNWNSKIYSKKDLTFKIHLSQTIRKRYFLKTIIKRIKFYWTNIIGCFFFYKKHKYRVAYRYIEEIPNRPIRYIPISLFYAVEYSGKIVTWKGYQIGYWVLLPRYSLFMIFVKKKKLAITLFSKKIFFKIMVIKKNSFKDGLKSDGVNFF